MTLKWQTNKHFCQRGFALLGAKGSRGSAVTALLSNIPSSTKLDIVPSLKQSCMKQQFKKWALRLGVTGLVTTALLLIIIRNPILAYANKITYNNYAIFHGKPFDPALITKLNQATELLKRSEFHNSKLQIDICKNDGSKYPMLMQTLYGQAFA